jgi:acyl-CoA synthetase (AMP-forming)/AMP-acid ligase II
MYTIVDAIGDHARSQPDALAFWSPRATWSFSELEDASCRVAQGLREQGITLGDRVACLTKHTAECVVLTLAANKVGAVCMPVNWRLAAGEIEYIVNNGQARVMLVDQAFADVLDQIEVPTLELELCTETSLATGAGVRAGFREWMATFERINDPVRPAPHDSALQLYSSGTTGLPKGVELTHANLAAGILGTIPESLGYNGPPDVMLNVLPTYHIAGVGIGLLTASRGGYSVLYPDFAPSGVIAAIAEHNISHAFLVPAMIQFLLQSPDVGTGDYSTLRAISYGASPITQSVLLGGMSTFKCDFAQVYGLTETTGSVTALPAEDHDPNGPRDYLLRSAGKALQGVEILVVDTDSGEPCADGDVGEVWIRTHQNMKGYWANEEATREAFVLRKGDAAPWFRSGDAGYMRDGYVFMHDRIKDMIVSGGENIYPAEIENALMQHPDVADGAVIGVPDADWGEAVKACVVLVPGASATEDDIIGFLRQRIAHFKCPRSVTFSDEIPRNPTGKILKRVLREPYWQGVERHVN